MAETGTFMVDTQKEEQLSLTTQKVKRHETKQLK